MAVASVIETEPRLDPDVQASCTAARQAPATTAWMCPHRDGDRVRAPRTSPHQAAVLACSAGGGGAPIESYSARSSAEDRGSGGRVTLKRLGA